MGIPPQAETTNYYCRKPLVQRVKTVKLKVKGLECTRCALASRLPQLQTKSSMATLPTSTAAYAREFELDTTVSCFSKLLGWQREIQAFYIVEQGCKCWPLAARFGANFRPRAITTMKSFVDSATLRLWVKRRRCHRNIFFLVKVAKYFIIVDILGGSKHLLHYITREHAFYRV